jgi:hypothetical protein
MRCSPNRQKLLTGSGRNIESGAVSVDHTLASDRPFVVRRAPRAVRSPHQHPGDHCDLPLAGWASHRQRPTVMPDDRPEQLDKDALTERHGIGRNSTCEAIKRGELPALKIGRRIVVPRVALQKVFDGNNPEPDA